ncbi:hypothetical protein [Cytobacillus purgationiresistens]|uniref:Uncharacterized protein n=1 Tax=Cytobacillus purgationiresistens TaxID=863449 RepID=A0ABU0ABV3_9BACI|nr:hypothetical protein [Cytobacillus purgationiresistens]MDQ0268727.1 hypothetical protein [Cytobacillus purgationiresistens]
MQMIYYTLIGQSCYNIRNIREVPKKHKREKNKPRTINGFHRYRLSYSKYSIPGYIRSMQSRRLPNIANKSLGGFHVKS